MNRFFTTILIGLLFSGNYLLAQTRTVTGTIKDLTNNPMVGVNVIIKGTTKGTTTNIDGKYSLEVPAEATLLYSFIGYKNQEIAVGNQSVMNVTLEEDIQQMNEVVVTALGFKEDRDKLGATSAQVSSEDLVRSGESGLINGLAGRAAGVRISRSNGDPGAGSLIQIRGTNTISGDTQPLIILDGIPVSNSNLYGEGSSRDGGVSQQSRLNDINPNDIESVQILKGASAAALWGSRAANGVIVITTKSGKLNSKINVSYGATYSIDEINVRHPLQDKFGQGSGGVYSPTSSTSWGDKIADRSGAADELDTSGEYFEADNGNRYYPIITKNSQETYLDDNFNDVFKNGNFLEQNLSLSGGSEKATFFFSIGDLNQEGIIKNSDYRRTTLRLNNTYTFNEYVSMKTKAGYTRSVSNRIQQSSNTAGLYLGLLRGAPDFDITDYIGTYYDDAGNLYRNRHRSYRRYLGNNLNPIYNNPLWTTNQQTSDTKVDRFIVNSEITVSPVDFVDVVLRGGVDSYTDNRVYFFPKGTAGADRVNGSLRDETYTETEYNFDAIARTFFDINDNISTNFTVGWNINDRKRKRVYIENQSFLFDSYLPNFEIAPSITDIENDRRFIRSNRLYSVLGFDLYNQVFVNLSGAYEVASTIDGGFFYPSADVAWQFTELPSLSNLNFLSFGKLRASWGRVGVQPDPHKFETTYESFSYYAYSDGLDIQLFDGGFRLNDDEGNPQLKPEVKTEWEIGTDLRFVDNRIILGFTYYQNKIEDLLIDVGKAPTTGFNNQYANAATMENKGIELDAEYNFLRKADLSMSIYGNFNNNRNEVLDLQGTESIDYTPGGSISSRAVVGYPSGVLYSSRAIRNEDGTYDLDDNGFPQLAPDQGVVGDPNPDWRGGLGFKASYKGLSLNVLFEHFHGGDFAERTRFILQNFGTHADVGNEVTLTQELRNVNGEVFGAGSTVRGNIADFGAGPVLLDQAWYTSRGAGFGSSVINEFALNKGTWTKLREISLSYTLNSPGFREKTKLSSVVFTLTGRNLKLWTNLVGVDPETNQFGVGNGYGIDYFTNPGTRSYLFAVKVNY
ncbi:SusC/RagA family TonB-linked outer membrane protein [Chondrinema litorale]|uniref:SusC/RagA family TonB-linked outer membrane protein n=1 Tax=Chondrinema litorale TaxID=2994555 RepID=UPI002543524F|nr:SusC/RagA family TonB-linked outer membrane protein [Chondrinema litorale]UZR98650.1 SusC/RagA family TonB-linked outer membrane protein [Chondrinema litorale]